MLLCNTLTILILQTNTVSWKSSDNKSQSCRNRKAAVEWSPSLYGRKEWHKALFYRGFYQPKGSHRQQNDNQTSGKTFFRGRIISVRPELTNKDTTGRIGFIWTTCRTLVIS